MERRLACIRKQKAARREQAHIGVLQHLHDDSFGRSDPIIFPGAAKA
jgi:hypothetical protein